MSQQFINEIAKATLDNGKLDEDVISRLRNPDTDPIDISDPDIRLSINLYLACSNASQKTYSDMREAIICRYPHSGLLTYYSVRKLVTNLTGVIAIRDDMCINSCHAFTGPFADLDSCTVCSEPRKKSAQVGHGRKLFPRQQMTTIPLGPQIQALRRSLHGSNAMSYRDEKLKEIFGNLGSHDNDFLIDDIFCGDDIIDFAQKNDLKREDTTVMFSLDGAQLYQNKKSDTWIAVWILTDYNPKTRYRSKHVLPALIVPGPNKPKILDSFLFRNFHHLSALQRENNGAGLQIFDAVKNSVVSSRIFLLFGTADAVGLPELDGRVGHHGALGCRKGCSMKGRHKPGSGHYFAAHLIPNDYSVIDCRHADFNFRDFDFQLLPTVYQGNLDTIISSMDQNDYEKNRKLTGLSKPSILSGLNPTCMLPIPLCFTVDIMHLFCLNIGDLFIPLWRGTFKSDKNDDKTTWDWATLTGDIWLNHGQLVASTTQYFPSSFHRPPRNPAEKISSGYKATEYYQYLFGLGPGFFRAVLPKKYWINFCKLIRGVRIVMQRTMSGKQIQEAHTYMVQFVEEFENIYYQRMVARLHFCRPSIHSALHTPAEALRVGNACLTSQYTMERAIGELGRGIHQPSDPFGNLSQLALRRAQINALKSICPELDTDDLILPKYSQDLGNGYVFLRPRDQRAVIFSEQESDAVNLVTQFTKRRRWGRLRLPTGQVARSAYAEDKRTSENKRVSRNIKVFLNKYSAVNLK